ATWRSTSAANLSKSTLPLRNGVMMGVYEPRKNLCSSLIIVPPPRDWSQTRCCCPAALLHASGLRARVATPERGASADPELSTRIHADPWKRDYARPSPALRASDRRLTIHTAGLRPR